MAILLSKDRSEMNESWCQKRGAILPFVMGIVLAVTLLLTSLLQMPGGMRLSALRYLKKQQEVYDAESALLAYLNGFPEGYFKCAPWNVSLPKVNLKRLGPWAELSSENVHVLAGVVYDSATFRSYEVRRKIYEGFRQVLNDEIKMALPPMALQIKSGNRRVGGRLSMASLWVQDGDLTLNLDGKVLSCRFLVDGSAEVRGSAVFDTLRIYSRGPLYLRGNLKVRWLEAFSENGVEISQGIDFSGVIVARHEVAFRNGFNKVSARKPFFVMALENSEMSSIGSSLAPNFIPGKLKPFEWKLKQ